jgi:hypothetical protein
MCKTQLSLYEDYKKLNLPLLTEQDEEYHMLREVAEEYARQHEKTAEKKSGNATENVIRNHLLSHGFNVALNPELKIHGSNETSALSHLLHFMDFSTLP